MAKSRNSAPKRAAKSQAPSPVTIDGVTTTRTYEDGNTSTLTHASEAAAKEYVKSCKGVA